MNLLRDDMLTQEIRVNVTAREAGVDNLYRLHLTLTDDPNYVQNVK